MSGKCRCGRPAWREYWGTEYPIGTVRCEISGLPVDQCNLPPLKKAKKKKFKPCCPVCRSDREVLEMTDGSWGCGECRVRFKIWNDDE